MTFNMKNPRSKKIKNIRSHIAKFMKDNTRENETEAHKHLRAAMKSLELASNELVKNDNEPATDTNPG